MTNRIEELRAKIDSRSAHVAVVGLGYVGLPMAQLTAVEGFRVTGIEIDQKRVDMINNGESYIQDVSSEQLHPLVEEGRLRATADFAVMSEVDIVMITVPTPLNKTGDPDMGYIMTALDSIKQYLHPGMLLSLESTTYPGTTEEILVSAIEEAGYQVGEDIFVSFSPERIDPGNPNYTAKNTPKVVGGVTRNCTELATAFYGAVVDHAVPVNSSVAAEMVKLYENTFRAVNIGLVNELAIMCDLLKVDVWEIINAANTKPFGFMPFYPGPGLGGHCIPVDPSYLSWKMRTLHYKARFIDMATEINTKMPVWVVNRIAQLLNDVAKPVKGSSVLILGMAYKNDIDDLRESPSLDVFDLLKRQGAAVRYHDPYCPKVRLEHGDEESVPLTAELLREMDIVVITTGHKERVDYSLVLENAGLIFDTRNITREMPNNSRVVYL